MNNQHVELTMILVYISLVLILISSNSASRGVFVVHFENTFCRKVGGLVKNHGGIGLLKMQSAKFSDCAIFIQN